MLFSYDECIKKYGNHYQLNKEIRSEKLYKICPGIYSDKKRASELEIIVFKYPFAVFTMECVLLSFADRCHPRQVSFGNLKGCIQNFLSKNKAILSPR